MAPGDQYFEDLLKIVISYTGERNTAENILYASCSGAHGASISALETVANTIGEYIGANLMPLVSEAIALSEVLVADWTSSDGLTGFQDFDDAGSLTGGKLPSQVAVLCNFETNTRFRGGHGRIYFPQPDTTKLQTDTTWTTAFQTAITDFIVAFLDTIAGQAIGDNLLTPVLYHRDGNKVVPQGFEDILGAGCSITPGTQRRRVRRVGHIA